METTRKKREAHFDGVALTAAQLAWLNEGPYLAIAAVHSLRGMSRSEFIFDHEPRVKMLDRLLFLAKELL